MRKHRIYGVSLATLAAVGVPFAYRAVNNQGAGHPASTNGGSAAAASAHTHTATLTDYTIGSADAQAFWNFMQLRQTNPGEFEALYPNWAQWMIAAASQAGTTDGDGDTDGDTAPASSAPAAPVAPAPTASVQAPVSAQVSGGGGAGGAWASLRQCESGGNYAENTGNGYYGAYQFSLQTWQGIGMSGLPSNASPATQDAAAQSLQAQYGWAPWPACSAKLGL